jgi:hypothetical protein
VGRETEAFGGGYITTTDGGANQIKIIKKKVTRVVVVDGAIVIVVQWDSPVNAPRHFRIAPDFSKHGNVLNFIPD